MNSKVKSILRIIFYPLLTLKRNYYMHNLRNAVYNNPKKAVDMIWKNPWGILSIGNIQEISTKKYHG